MMRASSRRVNDMAEPVVEYSISAHAALEMERRGIDAAAVGRVLAAPEQRESVRLGRDVLQSRIEVDKKTYLVRVFVDTGRRPAEVVTAYRTSKIEKYWRRHEA
jgi:hypothetical protein